ncbi:MAG: hypothetical protein ABEI86_06210 [Halobacteriaceae archaeon]
MSESFRIPKSSLPHNIREFRIQKPIGESFPTSVVDNDPYYSERVLAVKTRVYVLNAGMAQAASQQSEVPWGQA